MTNPLEQGQETQSVSKGISMTILKQENGQIIFELFRGGQKITVDSLTAVQQGKVKQVLELEYTKPVSPDFEITNDGMGRNIGYFIDHRSQKKVWKADNYLLTSGRA